MPTLGDMNKLIAKEVKPIPQAASGNVQVFCRFRPLNQREINMGEKDYSVVKFLDDKTLEIAGINPDGSSGQIKYTYDGIFNHKTSQSEIFDKSVQGIVQGVMEGFNGTVFAYGQTSSGKTHTMTGPDIMDKEGRGVIPRMVSYVFDQISQASQEIEFTVKVSMIEIYMEKIQDLLDRSKTNLKVAEDKMRGIFIQDVTEQNVIEEAEVYNCMKIGNENRSIGCTDMNAQSSRSHSVFILTVYSENSITFVKKTGKLYLVDLAGSEKIAKTGAAGQTLEEAKTINKSLSTLGQVINALTDGKSTHVPYRDSKLTRVLQESLGGNARTALIITCSPAKDNEEETTGTLKFGQRAKNIKNKPKVNKDETMAELKKKNEIQESEISKLKLQVQKLEKQLQKALKGQSNQVQSSDSENSVRELKIDEDIEEDIKSEDSFQLLTPVDLKQQLETQIRNNVPELLIDDPLVTDIHESINPESFRPFVQTSHSQTQTTTIQLQPASTMTEDQLEQPQLQDLECDQEGHIIIFTKVGQQDEFHEQYKSKPDPVKVLLLQASLKGKLFKVQELLTKVQYIKSKYFEQCLLINSLQGKKPSQDRDLQDKDKKVRELESALQTFKESNDVLLEDKVDLQKQLLEVESICKQQLLLTQQQATKTQLILRETISKQSDDKRVILEVISGQKAKQEELEASLLKAQDEVRQLQEAIQVTGDKGQLSQQLIKKDSDLKQLNMIYMQLATEKSALFREKMQLTDKLERKRDKAQFTQKQLELTIKQFDQTRREKEQLLMALQKTTKGLQMDLNTSIGTNNVRRSIRGGMRAQGPNQSVVVEAIMESLRE